MKNMLFAFSVAIFLAGCANLNSVYRTFDISSGESPMVDIRQRAVLIAPNKTVTETLDSAGKTTERTTIDRGMFVCAEPSPDAMASLAYEIAAKGGTPAKASGELALSMQDSAAFTGIRTQSIQLLRDFGYRLCESHMSGAITSAQYDLLMRRYQKNTVALLAIEQLTGTVKTPTIVLTSSGKAEAAKSITEQVREKNEIGDQISSLESQKKTLEEENDAAEDGADTSENDKKIANIDENISGLKSDKKLIEKAIEDTKGVLSDGRTDVTIKTDSATAQRTDGHLQKIAETVKEIVNNIVLSDDQDQICLAALQVESKTAQQKAFTDWCQKTLNAQATAQETYLAQLKSQIQAAQAQAVAPASTPAQKAEANKLINENLKKLEKGISGPRTFMHMNTE